MWYIILDTKVYEEAKRKQKNHLSTRCAADDHDLGERREDEDDDSIMVG